MKTRNILCAVITVSSVLVLILCGCFSSMDDAVIPELTLTGVANDAFLSASNNVEFYCYVQYGGRSVNIARSIAWSSSGGGKYSASIIDSPEYNDLAHVYVFTFKEDNDGDQVADDKFMLNVTSGAVDGQYVSMTPATTFAALGVTGLTSFSGTGVQHVLNDVKAVVETSGFGTGVSDSSVAAAKSAVGARFGLSSLDHPDHASLKSATVGQNYLTPQAIAGSGVALALASLAGADVADTSALTLKDSDGNVSVPVQTEINIYLGAQVTSVNGTSVSMGIPEDLTVSLTGIPEFSLPSSSSDTSPVFSAEISFAATRDVTTTVSFAFEGKNKKAEVDLSALSWDSSSQGFVLSENALVTIRYYPKKLLSSYTVIKQQYNYVSNDFAVSSNILTVNLTSIVSKLLFETVGSLSSGQSYNYSLEFGGVLLSTDGAATGAYNRVTGKISKK